MSFTIPKWSHSMDKDCSPKKYVSRLLSGKSLPKFIRFNDDKLTFRLMTLSLADVGFYKILVRGTTKYFNPEISNTYAVFSLFVKCVPKRILISPGTSFNRIKVS